MSKITFALKRVSKFAAEGNNVSLGTFCMCLECCIGSSSEDDNGNNIMTVILKNIPRIRRCGYLKETNTARAWMQQTQVVLIKTIDCFKEMNAKGRTNVKIHIKFDRLMIPTMQRIYADLMKIIGSVETDRGNEMKRSWSQWKSVCKEMVYVLEDRDCPTKNKDCFLLCIYKMWCKMYLARHHEYSDSLQKAASLRAKMLLILSHVECCEWTGWSYFTISMYHLTKAVISGNSTSMADELTSAYKYMEISREHFLQLNSEFHQIGAVCMLIRMLMLQLLTLSVAIVHEREPIYRNIQQLVKGCRRNIHDHVPDKYQDLLLCFINVISSRAARIYKKLPVEIISCLCHPNYQILEKDTIHLVNIFGPIYVIGDGSEKIQSNIRQAMRNFWVTFDCVMCSWHESVQLIMQRIKSYPLLVVVHDSSTDGKESSEHSSHVLTDLNNISSGRSGESCSEKDERL